MSNKTISPFSGDSGDPRYENPIDDVHKVQERLYEAESNLRLIELTVARLDDTANQLEFARRHVRDGTPFEARELEERAHGNLLAARKILETLIDSWNLARAKGPAPTILETVSVEIEVSEEEDSN